MAQKQYNLANNQIQELKEAFDAFDTDRSGEISSSELRKVLQSLEIDYVEDELKELMAAMDRNGDGRIQFQEFAKTMGSKHYATKNPNDIVSIFKQFDRDNSGSISVVELQQALKQFRGNVTRREAKELVKRADKDGNGSINIAEFIALITQL